MVRSSEIDDCTMLFLFTSARKRNRQRNFSFITKGTELSPRFRVFFVFYRYMTIARGAARPNPMHSVRNRRRECPSYYPIVARNNGIGKILLRLKFSFMRGEGEKSL